jgi:dUTPase
MSFVVKKLHPDAVTLVRRDDCAGFLLYALNKVVAPVNDSAVVRTGLRVVSLPPGAYGRITCVAMADGAFDVISTKLFGNCSGFLDVVVSNRGDQPLWIQKGECVAQLILERVDTTSEVVMEE